MRSTQDPHRAAAGAGYAGPFIDFHTHLFPDPLWRAILGWFGRETEWRFPFRGMWQEGAAFLEGLSRLERYVCCGYAHRPGIARELNRFYAELPQHSPKAVPLGCAHQDDPDLAGLAEEAFAQGLWGFKIHGQVQRVAPDDPRWAPLYEVVADRGGFVLFHAGNGPFPEPHTGFERFRGVLREHPTLRCVIAHLGCFEAERFLGAALDHDNLYLDTAYTFLDNPSNRMDAPLELLEAAAHKVLFATDFPGICHGYADGVRAIAELPLSDPAKEAIFLGNARRFLGLSGEG